ncbi:putative quinone oxidoreductase [Xylogone sp. PMI_703]|nr:putative quinone oxidoreductase [Xylogone sp. PMI_703]
MASQPEELTAQLQCLQKGGPFKIVHVPKPATIAADQVLIRQRVIALNGLDWKQRDFAIHIERWPHVLGIEGAGVIELVGSDVKDLAPGDEVTAWMAGRAHNQNWGGAYQEHVVMPARYVAKKPKNISLEEAASLPICYNTAICGLYGLNLRIPIPPFDDPAVTEQAPSSILILGGSSAIGAAAIQLLRLAYPQLLIFATSSPSNHERVLSLGATQPFDYHSSTLVADIKAASPAARGVEMILDCVSAGAAQTDIYDALDVTGPKKYAAVISGIEFPVPEHVTKLDISGWALVDMPGGERIIPALTWLIETGKYRVPLPVKVVAEGLDQIPNVLDQIKSVTGTKLVVKL